VIRATRESKQQIAHPVDEADRRGADRFVVRERHHLPFGTPADRPCHMQPRGELASPGKHECPQRLVDGVRLVDPALRFGDLGVAHAVHAMLELRSGRRGKICAELEETILKQGENARDRRERGDAAVDRGANPSDARIELVDRSVRLDARMLLADARVGEEPRRTVVTRARVETRSRRHGAVGFATVSCSGRVSHLGAPPSAR